ncbi:MAG TPA: NB-ARC domain-containing protein [Sphingobacteriaceae bacterium]
MNQIRQLHREAMDAAGLAFIAKRQGNEVEAFKLFRRAYELEVQAADLVVNDLSNEPTRSVLHRSAATLAIDCHEFREAERLIKVALAGNPPPEIVSELQELLEQVPNVSSLSQVSKTDVSTSFVSTINPDPEQKEIVEDASTRIGASLGHPLSVLHGAQGVFHGPINTSVDHAPVQMPGSAPNLPTLLIGREDDMRALKLRLGITADELATLEVLTVMRGWPGVGKSTLAAALAYDPEIKRAFPDGVLWASLGQHPSLFAELSAWGRALGVELMARTLEEAFGQLARILRDQRCLLIVNDVWEAEHALPFRLGGAGCALLITTHLPKVAQALAPTPADVYVLDVLTEDKALELLRQLARGVVDENPEASRELVKALEGLPLAIQVAGRLLNAETRYGFDVCQLLNETREDAKLIQAQSPTYHTEVTPTIAALFKKSTDLLDPQTLERFAYLGAFAPKPATFDQAALRSVWQVQDARPTIRVLVDRGLLEPISENRYWMHSLLVEHARSFLTE